MSLKPRLLVAEDDPELRATLREYLEELGFLVEAVAGGRDALEWHRWHRADGIVSDVQMPDGDGIELLKRIRQSGDPVPFFMLTGAHWMTVEEAKRLGVTAFFEKPNGVIPLCEQVRLHFFRRPKEVKPL
jgi:CheY-like chemotaxis protein